MDWDGVERRKIDWEKVKGYMEKIEKFISRLLKSNLDTDEIYELLVESGILTSEQIVEISDEDDIQKIVNYMDERMRYTDNCIKYEFPCNGECRNKNRDCCTYHRNGKCHYMIKNKCLLDFRSSEKYKKA